MFFYGCKSSSTTPLSESTSKDTQPAIIGSGDDSYGIYNPENVVTITGKVLNVIKFDLKGPKSRLDIKLSSNEKEYLVHTGPVYYMEKLGADFKQGDTISVTGSTVVFNDKTRIIATELKDKAKTFKIRNAKGIALWPQGGKIDGTTPNQLKLAK
jgi:hypothetical protein